MAALSLPSAAPIFDAPFIPVRGQAAIPIDEILPWAVFSALIAVIFLYFVSTEQSAYALFDGMYVNEFVQDGRHLLGFPCH